MIITVICFGGGGKNMITDFSAWRNRQYQTQTGVKMILDDDEVLSGPLPENLSKNYNYAFRRDDSSREVAGGRVRSTNGLCLHFR